MCSHLTVLFIYAIRLKLPAENRDIYMRGNDNGWGCEHDHRGGSSCFWKQTHAMLPPSDDTEWIPSPRHLLSLELQGMTSPLISKHQLGWWQMQKDKPWLLESIQNSLLLSLSWFSCWYLHYKHWKEHSGTFCFCRARDSLEHRCPPDPCLKESADFWSRLRGWCCYFLEHSFRHPFLALIAGTCLSFKYPNFILEKALYRSKL